MRWTTAIIPLKLVRALFSLLVALAVFELGGGPVGVGYVFASLSIGDLLGSLIFGRIAFYPRKQKEMFVFGFIGITFCLLILVFYLNLFLLYVDSFLFALLSNAPYFASLSILSRHKKGISKRISKFESIGGWAWVIGLALGIIIRNFFSIPQIFALLLIISTIGTFYSLILFERKITIEIAEQFKKEKGLLIWVEDLIDLIQKEEEKVFKSVATLTGAVRSSFPFVKIVSLKFPTKYILFHFSFFLIFLSFGIVDPQIVTLVKQKEFGDSVVYALSFIASFFSAIYYSKVGKMKISLNLLKSSFLYRLLIIPLAILAIFYAKLIFLFLIVIFSIMAGITWALFYIVGNTLILEKAKEQLGINNFQRILGYIIGNFISGKLISLFGFAVSFGLATVIATIAFLAMLKQKF